MISPAMWGKDEKWDCIIAGAGFAGLACATALARRGRRVKVLEKKASPGEKLRTTGIIVRDAVDRIPLLGDIPPGLVREISAVRLYAPNLRSMRIDSPGYYFLATDTPGLMAWFEATARDAGADIAPGSPFREARPVRGGWHVPDHGACRYLVGADGTRSAVAAATGLGANRELLHGIEYEYPLTAGGPALAEPDALHCLIDRDIAPGYIAWALRGVRHLQVGLARRGEGEGRALKTAMRRLFRKLEPLVSLGGLEPDSVRAGPIPCGGLVRPLAGTRVLLVGDAAGMVSPLTAGGIHTAVQHGLAAGHAIADFLEGRSGDPADHVVRRYPRFRAKRLLRRAYDHLQRDWLFNVLLTTPILRIAARRLYFHH